MIDRRPHRKMTINPPESLDERIVPSGLAVTHLSVAAQEAIVSAKGGQVLGSIYQEYISYEHSVSHGAFSPSEAGQVLLKGLSIGVDIHLSGNFNNLVKQLRGEGLKVTALTAKAGDVQGYLPISELPTVVTNGHETGISPIAVSGSVAVSPPTPVVVSPTVTSPSAVSDPVTVVSTKGGPELGSIYQQYLTYEQAGGQGAFVPSQSGRIAFSGTSVGVEIRISGDLNAAVGQLQGSGMLVTATSAQSGIVEGYVPIADLPTVAGDGQVIGLSPIYRPILRGTRGL